MDSKDGERPCHRSRARRRQESRFGPADVTTSLATRSDTYLKYLNYHDLFLFPTLFSFHTFPSCERGEKEERLPTYGTLRFEHENISRGFFFSVFLFLYTEERD